MPFRCGACVLVVAGVLAGAAPGVVSAQAVDDPYYQFLIARHLMSEGDASGALAALDRAAAADPDSAEVRAEIAMLQYRANKHDEAEKAAKAALALDGNNAEANRVLGYLYTNAAQNDRATAAERTGYVRQAIAHFERVAVQGPPDIAVTSMLGRLYLTNGEVDKAVESLTQTVNENPFSYDARRLLAMAFAAGNDYASAIAALEDLAEEEPRVLGLIGDYQAQAGMHADAAAMYARALAAQPNSREIKAKRIEALYRSGQYDEAASSAADAQRQHPADPAFPGLQVQALVEAGQYERAASVAADAQRQHPDNPAFPPLQAQALFMSGNERRAIDLLESAVETFPKNTTVQYALADLYSDAGRRDDAEKTLRQILALNPSDPDALNYLGYLLAVNGRNLDEAIRLVSRALEVRPNNGAYLDSLGWAHFRRGDLNEAEKYLGQAVDRMPGNSEVLDHMGDLHAARDRWQDAIDAWSLALAGNGDGIEPAVLQRKIEDARGRLAR